MNNRYFWILSLAAVFSVVACNENEEMDSPFINVEEVLSVPSSAGTYRLQVESNRIWNLRSNLDWVTVTPKYSDGNAEVEVKVAKSALPGAREAELTFKSVTGATTKKVKVIQNGVGVFGNPVIEGNLFITKPSGASVKVEYENADEQTLNIVLTPTGDAFSDFETVTMEIGVCGTSSFTIPVKGTPAGLYEATFVLSGFPDGDRQCSASVLPVGTYSEPFISVTDARIGDLYEGVISIPYEGVAPEVELSLNVIPGGAASSGFNPVTGFKTKVSGTGVIEIPVSGTPVNAGPVVFAIEGIPGMENVSCSIDVTDPYIIRGVVVANGGGIEPKEGETFNVNNYGGDIQDASVVGLSGWEFHKVSKAQTSLKFGLNPDKVAEAQGYIVTPALSSLAGNTAIIVSCKAYSWAEPPLTMSVILLDSDNNVKETKEITVDVGGRSADGKFKSGMKEYSVEFSGVSATDRVKYYVPKFCFIKDMFVRIK